MIINFNKALEILRKELNVAIPTETVYGLAGRIDSKKAIESIFQKKERPFYDPLIIHVSSYQQAENIFETNAIIEKLATEFWPGPLTIISNKKNHISSLITSGLKTVAVRIPNHELTLKLLTNLDVPLAAPSANKFKKTSPSKAEHVLEDFQNTVPVLDGGHCSVGIESTILEVKENTIIFHRPGQITEEEIKRTLSSYALEYVHNTQKNSPGSMKDHYQPKIPFYITSKEIKDGSELILNNDPSIAARELYHQMRVCSLSGAAFIYINKEKYPQSGYWKSIWDRINKASTKDPLPFS